MKEPLTSIKGYLQLLIEAYSENLEENIISIINKVLNRCQTLENKIIEYLDKSEIDEERAIEDIDNHYDILLIEDDVETLSMLRDYFESLDISCKGIENGLGGLRELKRKIPKLILLDIILLDISGYDIIKKIRADEKLKKIPIYFLTAIPRHKVEKKAQELEATGIILKLFSLKDFQIIIKYIKERK
ncbi:MAG: response regulator [Promethearchaeota archaeon]